MKTNIFERVRSANRTPRMMRAIQLALISVAAIVAIAGQVQAAIVIDLSESGGNVNATLSGSFDLNAVGSVSGTSGTFNGYLAAGGNIAMGSGTTQYYLNIPSWTPFGTGGFGNWTSSSGDAIALYSNPALGLPNGYVSGTSLSGSATKVGATFASLGFTPGSYTTLLQNGSSVDSVTVNVGQAAPIPEPASVIAWCLMGLTMSGGVWWRRRRAA